MKTNVYVDGFNLYYGCLKKTPYRWLDLAQLCRLMLPGDTIHRIRYFTARVAARPNDPDQPVRQQTYLRALETIPNLTITYGSFLTHTVTMPVAHPVPGQPASVSVVRTTEKGSDVNLATYLLFDAFCQDCDTAVIISNDSDLREPVRIVTQHLGKPVGILNPHRYPSRELSQFATFVKQIREGVLAASQFSPVLIDSRGTFHKPSAW
ncbi:MAG: NYN domain-containing protein [Chloroflexota bacterium]|jgi:uncharacterized LabA/DUF88 family protein